MHTLERFQTGIDHNFTYPFSNGPIEETRFDINYYSFNNLF